MASRARIVSSTDESAKATVTDHICQAVQSTSNLLHLMQQSSPSQISMAEFTYPSWLSMGAMQLLNRILDPNPMTIAALENSHMEITDLYEVDGIKGLSQSSIKKLPQVSLSNTETMVQCGETPCSICLQDFKNGECARQLPRCKHLFHLNCKKNRTCKTFRNNLNKILATAYIRHEPWEMEVHKRNGVVYLDVHKLPERPQSELDRRRWLMLAIIGTSTLVLHSLCVEEYCGRGQTCMMM